MNKYIQTFDYLGFKVAFHFGSFHTMINFTTVCKILNLDQKKLLSNSNVRDFISAEATTDFCNPFRIIREGLDYEVGTYLSFIITHLCLHIDLPKVESNSDFIRWFKEKIFAINAGIIIPDYVTAKDAVIPQSLNLEYLRHTTEEYNKGRKMTAQWMYEYRKNRYNRLTGKDVFGGNNDEVRFAE